MKKLSVIAVLIIALLSLSYVYSANNILNVYAWAEEIPYKVIRQFEKETGIQVNYTSYDNNEAMFTKLRTNKNIGYDIVEPSSFFVERLQHHHMIIPLDKKKLSNFSHLDPFFLNQAYDPHSTFSVPFIWGITGIFINKNFHNKGEIVDWHNLINKKYLNQIMLLNEAREVFSMALLMLGYSINDRNPDHIQKAYFKIKELLPNVRVFNSDAVNSILIDEDATLGMAWNGDVYNASLENPNLDFIIPEKGFEIWADNFVILKNAPHLENAYRFLNFLMRPEIAKEVSLTINYATTNLTAKNLMPPAVRNNPFLYPSYSVLNKGQFEVDVGEEASQLFVKYWELIKMGG